MAKKERKTSMDVPAGPSQPRMNLFADPKSAMAEQFEGMRLGSSVTLTIKGEVSGLNMSEYSASFDLHVKDLSIDRGMSGDLKRFRRERSR